MMLSQERDFTVKLEAKVGRQFAGTQWVAEYGRYQATGKSATEAKEKLSAKLAEVLSNPLETPAFWHDDQGGTWVVVPDGLGSSYVYRFTDEGTRLVQSSSKGSPEEAFADAIGMTRIPNS